MNDEAFTYHLWHVHSYPEDGTEIVQTNITPGESSLLRGPSAAFIDALLRDARIEGKPLRWDCMTYRSSYQGDPLAEKWEDLWPVNWRLRVSFNELPRITPSRYESIGTHAHSVETSIGSEREDAALPCLVIADFESNDDAERARSAIERIGRFPVHVFAIDASIVQLQCELDPQLPDAYARGIPLAQSVIAACEGEGGITSFDERVEQRGEALHDEITP